MFKPKTNLHKPNAPKTKYLQAHSTSLHKNTQPIHSRSLADLAPNELMSTAKQNNHFSSVSSQREQGQESGNKSSLSKGPALYNRSNSNIAKLMAGPGSRNNSKKNLQKPQQAQNEKRKNGQQPIFTYNLSQMRTSSQASFYNECEPPGTKQAPVKKNPDTDYNLLIKLKDYIEELKGNQQKYVEKIRELEEQMQQKQTLLEDKIKVMEIRQKQLIRKLKALQKQQQKNTNECEHCHENQLIIQSLKNVINEQLTKIIQLERNRLQAESASGLKPNFKKTTVNRNMRTNSQCSQDSSKSGKLKEAGRQKSTSSMDLDEESFASIPGCHRNIEPEVYSFKKNYEQFCQHNEEFQYEEATRQKYKNSLDGVPQPYHEVIQGLKSDSSAREEDQEIQSQSEQYSEDGILQEVGNYLSNIRSNVMGKY